MLKIICIINHCKNSPVTFFKGLAISTYKRSTSVPQVIVYNLSALLFATEAADFLNDGFKNVSLCCSFSPL